MADKAQCADCGKFVDYLVDAGFCDDCFRKRLEKDDE